MTREEAIHCLSVYSSTNGSGLCTDEQHYEAKQIAIKTLEQEPIFDKIRTEIEKETDRDDHADDYCDGYYDGMRKALAIIDEYKEWE